MKDFSNYWKAITFCFFHHGNQKRKYPKIPYAVHPIRISMILRAAGFSEFKDEDLMVAALLHDIVEDTDTNLGVIKNKFGEKVASIVKELTKVEGVDKNKWLRSFEYASKEAKIIKMADRIDNLMDMGDFWSIEGQKSYADQGKIILNQCGEAHSWLAGKLEEVIEKVLSL